MMYVYPLLFHPTIIDEPGEYLTRCGETVLIEHVSSSPVRFDCTGLYAGDGKSDCWHRSGRIFAGTESANDIVEKIELTQE